MIVVDASAVLEVLLNTPAGSRIAGRLFAAGETLHAPHLLDLEVAQVLRRYALAGQLDPGRGLEALEDLADFPLTRYPHGVFLPRIWALRRNVTAYDAAYLALAEALAVPFVTRDAALVSVRAHRAKIELVSGPPRPRLGPQAIRGGWRPCAHRLYLNHVILQRGRQVSTGISEVQAASRGFSPLVK